MRGCAVVLAALVAVPLTSTVARVRLRGDPEQDGDRAGTATIVTVTGAPGENFAILGSSKGFGFADAGVPFSVGADFVLLAFSSFDGSGRAVVSVTPPFSGTELDRYYIQVATSPSPVFQPLRVSQGLVLLNADLSGLAEAIGAGPAGPRRPQGPTGPQGPAGRVGQTGAAGAAGPQGPAGAAGSQLAPIGAAGPPQVTMVLLVRPGLWDRRCPAGNDGAAGRQGPAGDDGAAGAPGNDGALGSGRSAGPGG